MNSQSPTFAWAKAMGGTSADYATSIAIDSFGNVYTIGFFKGTADFDPGAGISNLIATGPNYNIYISKLDAAGNFVWAKAMGGTSDDLGNSMASDGLGNVYTMGKFQGTVDFDPGPGTFNLTSTSVWGDLFISKLDASGDFVWTYAIEGLTSNVGRFIALDASGSVFTAGYFMNTLDFDPGAGTFNLTSTGAHDIFVHKMADFSTGIVENPSSPVIIIYPNPGSGIFTLSLSMMPSSQTDIRLVNTLGQIIYSEILQSQIKQFDFSYLQAATYYLLITNDGEQISKQLIITK